MDIISTILAALLVSLITWFVKIIVEWKKISNWKNEETISKLMKLGFTRDDEYNYIKSPSFIATHGQFEGPHENDEIFISDNRFPLVERLLKAFSKKDSIEKKRYAILGGSGMGKTTFAASFILNYYKQDTFKKPKYSLYVFYLGNPSVLDEIKQIKDNESILLLDALDENVEAGKNLSLFMDKLELITNNFRHVVLTCRTQFFSDKSSEPNQSSVIQNNPNKEALSYEVIYLSPFSEEETEIFLGNKFAIPSKEYTKAHQLVEKSKNLMARPMVLSFIEDIISLANNKTITNVEIYMKIIDGWFARECNNQKEMTIPELYTFSKLLSKFIYDKWKESSVYYISAQEYESFIKDNGYNSSPYSFKDRSLLNRRSDGSIKFAHRSFWEFFLAIYSLENPQIMIVPDGLESAAVFAKELYTLYLNNQSFPNIQIPCHELREKLDFTDPEFIRLLSKFDKIGQYNNITESKRRELLYKSLYRSWEILVNRYPISVYQIHRVFRDLKVRVKKTKESDPSMASVYDDYCQKLIDVYKKTISELMCDLQSCFLKSTNKDIIDITLQAADYLTKLRHELIIASYLLKEGKVTDVDIDNIFLIYDPVIPDTYLNDIFVLPYLSGLSDDVIKSILLNKYICISFGISSKSSMLKTIEFLTNFHNGLNAVYIYWDADNLDEYIEFILYVTSQIKHSPQFIYIRINIDNIVTYYAINYISINYKEKEVREIINIMQEAKKAISNK